MGFKKKAKTTVSPAPKATTTELTTVTTVETVEAQGTATETPPWTVTGCNACDGSGINSKGEVCRACDIVSGRTGGPTSSQFKTWVGDDGKLRWAEADGATAIEGPEKATATKPKTTKPKKTRSKKTTTKKTEPETRDEALTEVARTVADKAVLNGRTDEVIQEIVDGVGKAFGFTLYINCFPLGEEYVDLVQILKSEGAELAEAEGADSYYSMNAFERRDLLAKQAGIVAGDLLGKNVVVTTSTPDLDAYLSVLRGYAGKIVQGVS